MRRTCCDRKTCCIVLSAFFMLGCSHPATRSSWTADDDSDLTAGFVDGARHWYAIQDEARVIDPLPNQQRYAPGQVREIAENILLYQRSNGGWPKNYDMRAILTAEQQADVERTRSELNTTFDNGATHSQIRFLADAYRTIGDPRYRDACVRGLEFTLGAQYPNGGWPQFFPDTSGYRKHITFNDGVTTGILGVLRRITEGDEDFVFVDETLRSRVKKAFDRAVACVLKCQIEQNGRKTVWCQQHDHRDLRPRNARSFEPAALCSMESAGLVLLLMSLQSPSAEVVAAIQDAVAWFNTAQLRGIRLRTVSAPETQYMYHRADFDRVVVQDPAAPPLWARFYELGTGKPLFCNRDGKPVYSLAEVDRERRTGYAWYTDEPAKVLKEYPRWQKAWAPGNNVLGRGE